jgi:hypothetical protein
MPAFSNFVGAKAAGFVGNAYLPSGFNNATHAGQRATLQFGSPLREICSANSRRKCPDQYARCSS